jgi:hypothetical protein
MTTEVDPQYKWTVMIYMAGDNNLSEECVYSLVEAKRALNDQYKKLSVLAQFDPSGERAQTKRYELSPKATLEEDAKATKWTASETDSGEAQNLLEFLRWGIARSPAEHYMVVLVGHGSGTDDDFLLHDDNPPSALTILELRYVFDKLTADGHTIDILGFDTCLMNMAEVCFELLRTNVTYMVGSEGYSPNTGWPYKEVLEKLSDEKSDVMPLDLATHIVEKYRDFYVPYINGGISIDQSVLEVKKIGEVKKQMSGLVEALMDDLDKDKNKDFITKRNALLLAHWDAQSYNGEKFVDLHDFCDQLGARYLEVGVENEVTRKCQAVASEIDRLVVKTCIAGAAFQFSYGLSIYFPWAILSPTYGNLAFPKETGWLDYLIRYHTETQRPHRDREQVRLPNSPYRATVPNNKGRDGHVESMRNPPSEEFIDNVGEDSKPPKHGPGTPDAKLSTKKDKETKNRNKDH